MTMIDEESSDDDFDFDAEQGMAKRYPVHDCCEFEDADALKDLIYVEVESSDEEESPEPARTETKLNQHESSSTDDNDSTAAAHAAAIGHSPVVLKSTLGILVMASSTGVLPSLPQETEPPSPPKLPGDQSILDNTTGIAHLLQPKPSTEAKDGEATDSPAPFAETKSSVQETDDHNESVEPDTSSETGNKPTARDGVVVSLEASQKEPSPHGADAMDVDTESSPPKANGDGSTLGVDSTAAIEAKSNLPASRKVVRMQVNRSINLNERDEDENCAIHVAIHARKLEHVKILLEAGASFRMRSDGSLPIHTAISIGSLAAHRQFAYECVVLLHEHGADLSVKDDAVHTPLFLACRSNLPQVVSYILSDEDGLATLNTRADRAGNRPLHAAAKYDTLDNPSLSSTATNSTQQTRAAPHHHHPDGSIDSAMHHIPRIAEANHDAPPPDVEETPKSAHSTQALLTQVLLGTNGIEVDALNVLGQTPLHIASMRRNWPVVRLLLHAGASPTIEDRRGFTPGQLAYKRGMPIPNDLVDTLGDAPVGGIIAPVRELIVDPDGSTLLLCHELCTLHRTCPPINRDSAEPPPENVRRLQVLVDPDTGILRSGEFRSLVWKREARRAAIGDVLKVHEYAYVERVSMISTQIPDHPSAIAHLDGDTAVSRWSFEAAMRAAGSICEAVDYVVDGDNVRNAFCAVRPPGHHAGPRGIVRCANDPEGGSHGFCLLNNVCIGAAYARTMYRNSGIRKVAIIDFDVHHGNGTEAIIRNLVPNVEKATIRTPFAVGEMSNSTYRPWLDETDVENVFFASTHGYGIRGFEQPGWFYPASGKTHTSEAISHPAMVDNPSIADFILTQTWSRMGEDSRANCCKIINVGLELPEAESEADKQSRSMRQRLELRDSYRQKIFPALRDFDPDIIFISAGFDAHRADTMNFGYVGMVEDDYEWLTEQLVKIANTCCNGRVISVLEGGYKIHGGIVSPFARSVASHVRGLVDGGRSRELYDPEDCDWEAQFERHLYERRERKKEQEREQLRLLEDANRRAKMEQWAGQGETPEDPDAPSRKRRRNQVNYKELFKQMQQEGFAG